jgi:hypothetical protein
VGSGLWVAVLAALDEPRLSAVLLWPDVSGTVHSSAGPSATINRPTGLGQRAIAAASKASAMMATGMDASRTRRSISSLGQRPFGSQESPWQNLYFRLDADIALLYKGNPKALCLY